MTLPKIKMKDAAKPVMSIEYEGLGLNYGGFATVGNGGF
jgi:hypothetical protein